MPGITNVQDNLICENKILNTSAESAPTMPFCNSPPSPLFGLISGKNLILMGRERGLIFGATHDGAWRLAYLLPPTPCVALPLILTHANPGEA